MAELTLDGARYLVDKIKDKHYQDKEMRMLLGQSPRVIYEDIYGDWKVKEGYLDGANTFTTDEKPLIKRILACGLEPTNGSSLRNVFQDCTNLEEFHPILVGKVNSIYTAFSDCKSLTSLDLSMIDTSNVDAPLYAFRRCTNLQILDITNFNAGNMDSTPNNFFYASTKIETLIGGKKRLDEVVFRGLNVDFTSLSRLDTLKLLDRYSLRAIINGLADRSGQTSLTLTIGNTLKAKLTEEDIAIATAKNWTIA